MTDPETSMSTDSQRGVAAPTATGEQAALFGDEAVVIESAPKLSADRRRTLRQKSDVEAGVHPLMRGPVKPDTTCGDCAHRIQNGWGYPKCDLTSMSHSATTDCRAWWPGCRHHKAVSGCVSL